MFTPYFNADALCEPDKNYVAFLDVMGMQNHLTSSLKTSANFMFKFHEEILHAEQNHTGSHQDIKVYPIMDGAYVTSPQAWRMRAFLSELFLNLCNLYLENDNLEYRFIPRGSLSFGEVYHGCDVPDKASLAFTNAPARRNSLLIGKPMVRAYQNEHKAAPFGIYIDDCASCNLREEANVFYSNWKWYKEESAHDCDVKTLKRELLEAFEDLAKTAQTNEELQRHKAHCRDIGRYFGEKKSFL